VLKCFKGPGELYDVVRLRAPRYGGIIHSEFEVELEDPAEAPFLGAKADKQRSLLFR
jgi:hypothetical protein